MVATLPGNLTMKQEEEFVGEKLDVILYVLANLGRVDSMAG